MVTPWISIKDVYTYLEALLDLNISKTCTNLTSPRTNGPKFSFNQVATCRNPDASIHPSSLRIQAPWSSWVASILNSAWAMCSSTPSTSASGLRFKSIRTRTCSGGGSDTLHTWLRMLWWYSEAVRMNRGMMWSSLSWQVGTSHKSKLSKRKRLHLPLGTFMLESWSKVDKSWLLLE